METTPHITDEQLAEYAAGRLSEREVPAVFEHVIVCDDCHDRYEAGLDFKRDLREAMARATAVEHARDRKWLDWLSLPKPVFVAATALAVIAVVIPVLRQGSAPVQDLELSAVRGAEDTTVARAGNGIRLHLVTAGLDASKPVMVQIADDSGREIWRGATRQTDRNWQVQPDKTFRTGRYWVRVLDPEQPDPPLREYSFIVK
jgi:hypothetical protein